MVQNYEDALLAGNFKQAWAMIGVSSHVYWGSYAGYTSKTTVFLLTSGTKYTLEIDPTDTLPLNDWSTGPSWGPLIDLKNAHLVIVHWTALSDARAGLEVWVVNPVKTGGWLMFRAV